MIRNYCIAIIILLIGFGNKSAAQLSAQDYFNLAYSSLEQKKNDSAMYYFSMVILKDTTMPNAYFNRGTLRLQNKDYLGAIDDFTKCLNMDVTFGRAYNNRGYSYLQLELYYEGCKDLRIAKDLSVPESIASFPLLCTEFKE